MNHNIRSPWWESRNYVFALIFLSMLPLLWPDVPPLVDLPGHMGRYRVELDLATSPQLQQFYSFNWQLIGNLGIDLLVIPLSKVFGLEMAVKLIVLAIPPLTATGLLLVAREVHGRIPPTAALALPLAYGYPFQFGFVNFALSIAFAFLAFALWLRLAHKARFWLRAAIFIPLSCIIWVTHTFGWGVLGVLAFASELIRHHDEGKGWIKSWFQAGQDCIPLALPLVLMVAWRSGQVGGQTADMFNWQVKFSYLLMVLRDRWALFDQISLGILIFALILAARNNAIGFSRMLGISAIFLLCVYLLLPRIVFGSAYADMRLAPFMLGTAVLAIRFTPNFNRRALQYIAIFSFAFFATRIVGTTTSYWLYDQSYDKQLAAITHIPKNARLVSFVGRPCHEGWTMARLEHLPAMALVRKHAFSNDQWTMAGAQLLNAHIEGAGNFRSDPSQIITSNQCPYEYWKPVNTALSALQETDFEYIWLINPPEYDLSLTKNMVPLWRSGNSVLFKTNKATK